MSFRTSVEHVFSPGNCTKALKIMERAPFIGRVVKIPGGIDAIASTALSIAVIPALELGLFGALEYSHIDPSFMAVAATGLVGVAKITEYLTLKKEGWSPNAMTLWTSNKIKNGKIAQKFHLEKIVNNPAVQVVESQLVSWFSYPPNIIAVGFDPRPETLLNMYSSQAIGALYFSVVASLELLRPGSINKSVQKLQ